MLVVCVRAQGAISPAARKAGREAHAPGFAAIPKTVNRIGFAARRDERDLQGALLERVFVFHAAVEALLEAAPLGNERWFRVSADGEQQCRQEADCQNEFSGVTN